MKNIALGKIGEYSVTSAHPINKNSEWELLKIILIQWPNKCFLTYLASILTCCLIFCFRRPLSSFTFKDILKQDLPKIHPKEILASKADFAQKIDIKYLEKLQPKAFNPVLSQISPQFLFSLQINTLLIRKCPLLNQSLPLLYLTQNIS